MNSCISKCALFATASLVMTLSIGCNKTEVGSVQPTAVSANNPETKSDKAETTSVVPTETATNLTSPASASGELDTDATAKDVCEQFMQNLQSGNRIAAENLLTRIALTNTSKEGLVLEPMGGPNSECKFGEVRYATNKQKLAQVDCTVSEKADGEEFEMDMTWVVRKQNSGWRIAGVMLQLEADAAKDLLSFENLNDVKQMKVLAGVEVIEQTSQPRQAANETLTSSKIK